MSDSEAAEINSSAESKADEFSGLVAGMSRLISGLAQIQLFKDAQFGLAEWVAVSTLAKKGDLNSKALALSLGVTAQRVNQMSAALSAAGVIEVGEPAAEGRPGKIGITQNGRNQLEALNSQLEELLLKALTGKERSIAAASKQMKILMRIVQMGTPAIGKKKAKKAKKAGGEEAAAVG